MTRITKMGWLQSAAMVAAIPFVFGWLILLAVTSMVVDSGLDVVLLRWCVRFRAVLPRGFYGA